MYSIKIESKPKQCKDCLFCRKTNPAVIGCTGYYCSVKIRLIEDVYRVSSWCPILKSREKPTQLQFSYNENRDEYEAKGTNAEYTIAFFAFDNNMTLCVRPSTEILIMKEGKRKLKPGNKEFKEILNELIEEAQQYENSCYAPVRAKRKDAE